MNKGKNSCTKESCYAFRTPLREIPVVACRVTPRPSKNQPLEWCLIFTLLSPSLHVRSRSASHRHQDTVAAASKSRGNEEWGQLFGMFTFHIVLAVLIGQGAMFFFHAEMKLCEEGFVPFFFSIYKKGNRFGIVAAVKSGAAILLFIRRFRLANGKPVTSGFFAGCFQMILIA